MKGLKSSSQVFLTQPCPKNAICAPTSQKLIHCLGSRLPSGFNALVRNLAFEFVCVYSEDPYLRQGCSLQDNSQHLCLRKRCLAGTQQKTTLS